MINKFMLISLFNIYSANISQRNYFITLAIQNLTMKKILFLTFLLPIVLFSQIPPGYYDGTSSLSGYQLKSKLHDIISQKYINWHYGDLTAFYQQTDLDIYYDHDSTNDSILLDIYSEIPDGPDAFEYTIANIIGSANAEGQGWNREHMMPQSTYNSTYPMYSDLFYVIPAEARINQLRSNYPYGMGGTTNYYTFSNTSKISKNATPNSGYTGRVYEPIDEFKGDVARALLYFAVRYEGKLASFNFYNGTSAANDKNPLDGTEEKSYEDWYIAMLLQWHNLDPVSQKEIDRNNAVFNIQKNRNPFIDHPGWVNLIWNQTSDGIIPQAPSNLSVSKSSAYFVNLSWNASADSDVLGYKIYQNGILVETTKKTMLSIDHLDPDTTYNFTVRAYDNGYLESMDSNLITATTLSSDTYAKDLMITKYLEGTSDNKALEITNKTGHPVNLNNYKISIQFSSDTNYYFPAAYELEGVVQHNENFVILNPYSNFSCVTNEQARFVTAAPQLTFTGNNYLELRYKSSTVDAIGIRDINNISVLGNISLYRLNSVNEPTRNFNLSEWQTYPSDYCEDLGVLATSNVNVSTKKDWTVFPNPVLGNTLHITGENRAKMQHLIIYDLSGKLIQQEKSPFKTKNSVDVSRLQSGIYMLQIDGKAVKVIKK